MSADVSMTVTEANEIIYPESDGKPMGENTLHIQCIIDLFTGLRALFADRPNVFAATNLFWYPVKGKPKIVQAPDVMVAFGRPKGDRPSYKQWEEGGQPPHVVIEVLSPSNTPDVLAKRYGFYEKYGVEEYYQYDPYLHELEAWTRGRRRFRVVPSADGYVSPRLGVRFEAPRGTPMRVVGPDGRPFRSYEELIADADREREQAARERDRLAAKLRALGVDPDAA